MARGAFPIRGRTFPMTPRAFTIIRRTSLLIAVSTTCVLTAATAAPPPKQDALVLPSRIASGPVDSFAPYRAHLAALIALVDRCRASTDLSHCNSGQVGADDHVPIPSPPGASPREVHYEWLRNVLTRAVAAKQAAATAKQATAPPKQASAPPMSGKKADPAPPAALPDSQALLAAARLHLLEDRQAIESQITPDHHIQRLQIATILAEREFDQVQHPSPWDRAVEAFFNGLNDLFSHLPSPGPSKWLQLTLEWGVVLGVSTALAWWLIQGSKRERWRLESSRRLSVEAPSLRDWQVWLAEAQAFAARGQWREAVHNVYWAAISQLESRGLWPVDRARTPREYLDLLGRADPQRSDLIALTRGFERIWYGHRPAAEPEYRSACELLDRLAAR